VSSSRPQRGLILTTGMPAVDGGSGRQTVSGRIAPVGSRVTIPGARNADPASLDAPRLPICLRTASGASAPSFAPGWSPQVQDPIRALLGPRWALAARFSAARRRGCAASRGSASLAPASAGECS
jgi:hypothetical protein